VIRLTVVAARITGLLAAVVVVLVVLGAAAGHVLAR
jgi:hypothetical protein